MEFVEKVVVDDIEKYEQQLKKYKQQPRERVHLFSHIGDGCVMQPYPFPCKVFASDNYNKIMLYYGGWGNETKTGHSIIYNIAEKTYNINICYNNRTLLDIDDKIEHQLLFKSYSWDEVYKYAVNYLNDILPYYKKYDEQQKNNPPTIANSISEYVEQQKNTINILNAILAHFKKCEEQQKNTKSTETPILNNMEFVEKVVVDDIEKYVQSRGSHTHLFSHINKGRVIHPCGECVTMLVNNEPATDNNKVILYGGGWGMGVYHDIIYDITEKTYEFYAFESRRPETPVFKSSSWSEVYEFTVNYLNAILAHFNKCDALNSNKESGRIDVNSEEQQYFDLCRRIQSVGTKEEGRNGATFSVFGNMMQFDLSDGRVPFMTHKRLAWRTCLTELIWFIRGRTDVAWLADRGCHIWDANGTREFLDSRGLYNRPEGELGPVYGHQWRNFGGEWETLGPMGAYGEPPVPNKKGDQLANIIAALRDPAQRTSRRLVMSAWNPLQLADMALPPCHILCQFNVVGGNRLSCALYQRSGDVGLGVPFNIASYSALTILLAAHCGLVPDKFVYFLGNAHIYEEHMDALMERISGAETQTYEFPKMQIKEVRGNIDEYDVDDFIVTDYKYDTRSLKLKMIA